MKISKAMTIRSKCRGPAGFEARADKSNEWCFFDKIREAFVARRFSLISE